MKRLKSCFCTSRINAGFILHHLSFPYTGLTKTKSNENEQTKQQLDEKQQSEILIAQVRKQINKLLPFNDCHLSGAINPAE